MKPPLGRKVPPVQTWFRCVREPPIGHPGRASLPDRFSEIERLFNACGVAPDISPAKGWSASVDVPRRSGVAIDSSIELQ